jgi:glycosyltransferase involved in cell wall biosynthesis
MRAIRASLRGAGYPGEVFADRIDPALDSEVYPLDHYAGDPDAAIVFHFSLGVDRLERVLELPDRKVLWYHNITPPDFFPAGSPLRRLARLGKTQLRRIAKTCPAAIADADFGRADLVAAGFRSVSVVPPIAGIRRLLGLPRTEVPASPSSLVLFVGRLAPDKNQLSLVAAFEELSRTLTPAPRLVLVGGAEPGSLYDEKVAEAVAVSPFRDAIRIAGKVDDAELAALYRQASVFVSLSRRERFGVPLVESMSFDVPVLALDIPATRELLGADGGLLASDAPADVAAAIRAVASDPDHRARLLEIQHARLARFTPAAAETALLTALKKALEVAPKSRRRAEALRESLSRAQKQLFEKARREQAEASLAVIREKEIRILDEMVAEKDLYIQSLRDELASLSGLSKKAEEEYRRLEKTIEAKDADAGEKERYVQSLRDELASLSGLSKKAEEEYRRLEKTIEAKDADAGEKERYVQSLLSMVEAKDGDVIAKDRYIESLGVEIAKLREALLRSQANAKALRRAVRDRERERRAPAPAETTDGVSDWSGFVACTIVSKNYISLARVCCETFLAHHPGARFYVLIADKLDGAFDPAQEKFVTLEADRLGIPRFEDFLFKYNILEFNTAVKPFLLDYLFEQEPAANLIYFDPDISIYAPLDALRRELGRAQIVLTPHILSPLPDDDRWPSEETLLVAGTYNLGFIALRRTEETTRFLLWWQKHLYDKCFYDEKRGLFTDQKWIDLVPSLYSGVAILKNPGYNAAYWNLHERRDISVTESGYEISGEPLVFFHFSGFEKELPYRISKHQNRYRLPDLPRAFRELFHGYARALDEHGWKETRGLPYHYGFFDNGAQIPSFMRRVYWEFHDQRARFGNPFAAAGPSSFFSWIMSPHRPESHLSNLLAFLWRSRPDVAAVYPDPEHRDALPYLQWVLDHSNADFGLNEPYQAAFRALVAKLREKQEEAARPALEAVAPAEPSPELAPAPVSVVRKVVDFDGEPRTPGMKRLQSLMGRGLYRRARRIVWTLRGTAPDPAPALPEVTADAPLPALPPVVAAIEVAGPPPRPFGVNLFSYLDTESGVGEIGRSLATMLEKAQVPHSLINVEQSWLRREDRTLLHFSDAHPYSVNLLVVNADEAPKVCRRYGLSRAASQYNVGYWFWELSSFPPACANAFAFFDEIWVGSDFCLDAISRAGDVPTVKMPPAIDPQPPGIKARADFGFDADEFLFLFIFDSASIIRRKNPAGLISAFRKAFDESEPVRLLLKTVNATPRQMRALERLSGPARVHVWNDYLNRGELLDLIAASDAYASLHRSEGLGLTPLEALLLDKPVVATDYSGVREFLVGPRAYPVDYRIVPLARDYGPYRRGNVWADPDGKHAAAQLRKVYERRHDPCAGACRARDDLARRYGVEETAARLKARLRLFAEKLSAAP